MWNVRKKRCELGRTKIGFQVHFDTRFTRYRKDGSVIGGFNSIYVVTCEDGRWGVKARSSYAP